MRISKSKFCAGVQCLKRLYLLVHEPEIAAEPDGTADAIIEQGREVGLLARKLFPGGIEVCSTGLDQAIRTTRELVANHELRTQTTQHCRGTLNVRIWNPLVGVCSCVTLTLVVKTIGRRGGGLENRWLRTECLHHCHFLEPDL